MEDINFSSLLSQARKIDESLLALSEKLQSPYTIGKGRSAQILIDDIEQEVSNNEEALDLLLISLKQNMSKLKLQNNQRREFISHIQSEIGSIEEIGKEIGFYIPVYELSRLNLDEISPNRSSSKLLYQETPISSHSLNHYSTPYS